MNYIKTLLLILFIGIITIAYSQKDIGININRNDFYQEKSRKNLLGNYGIGISVVKRDTRQRFINHEMSAGVEFDNLTFIDIFYNPPFMVDYHKIYTHSINNFSILTTFSLKKVIWRNITSQPYLGMGIAPNILLLSYAKVFYNNSMILRGNGLRLSSIYEYLKLYDLFYLGMRYKQIDFRVKVIGIILNKIGINDYYYFKSERIINYYQYSLQILIRLQK